MGHTSSTPAAATAAAQDEASPILTNTLTLTLLQATNVGAATQLPDVFITFQFAKQVLKSRIIKDDRNPVWNQEWKIEIPKEKFMEITIHDADFFAKDVIARKRVSIDELAKRKNTECWIVFDGDEKVQLRLELPIPPLEPTSASASPLPSTSLSTPQQKPAKYRTPVLTKAIAPTNPAQIDSSVPTATLEPTSVSGFRSPHAIKFLPNGAFVYPAAASAVIVNKKGTTILRDHQDDVNAVATHPTSQYIALGDKYVLDGQGPALSLWNGDKHIITWRLGVGKLARAVVAITFNTEGTHLIAVSENSFIYIFDVTNIQKSPIITESIGTDKIVQILSNPWEDNGFVTIGLKDIIFWKLDLENRELTRKKAIYGNPEIAKMAQQHTSAAFGVGSKVMFTGNTSGTIYEWDIVAKKCVRSIAPASGSKTRVVALETSEIAPNYLLSATSSGQVHLWPLVQGEADLKKKSPLHTIEGQPREIYRGMSALIAIDWYKDGNVVAGFADSTILRFSLDKTGKYTDAKVIMEGHDVSSGQEIWGLATHPDKKRYVTGGEDQQVILWQIGGKMLSKTKLKARIRSVMFHPSRKEIWAGSYDGSILILDESSLFLKTALSTLPAALNSSTVLTTSVLSASPDGKYVAAGCAPFDRILIYRGSDLMGTCKGHSSRVLNLDWISEEHWLDSEGAALRSQSEDGELLYWNIPNCQQVKNANAVRDAIWASETIPLTWGCAGLYDKSMDHLSISTVAPSPSRSLTVYGTTVQPSQLRLARYPAPHASSIQWKPILGHCAHVTNVRFLNDETCVTTGGRDGCVFEWKVKE